MRQYLCDWEPQLPTRKENKPDQESHGGPGRRFRKRICTSASCRIAGEQRKFSTFNETEKSRLTGSVEVVLKSRQCQREIEEDDQERTR